MRTLGLPLRVHTCLLFVFAADNAYFSAHVRLATSVSIFYLCLVPLIMHTCCALAFYLLFTCCLLGVNLLFTCCSLAVDVLYIQRSNRAAHKRYYDVGDLLQPVRGLLGASWGRPGGLLGGLLEKGELHAAQKIFIISGQKRKQRANKYGHGGGKPNLRRKSMHYQW